MQTTKNKKSTMKNFVIEQFSLVLVAMQPNSMQLLRYEVSLLSL